MFLLVILLLIAAWFAGALYGSRNPNILAEAQADLAKADAEGKRVAAAVMSKLHGLGG